MNRKPLATGTLTALIAAIALLSAGAAFAGEASDGPLVNFKPSKTRAQVVAEIAQARADGTINADQPGYHEPWNSVALRADVKKATRENLARFGWDPLDGEREVYTVATRASGRAH